MKLFVEAAGNAASNTARDWLTLLLAGLGVSLAPYEYFGGLFLSCAAASIIAKQRRDPRKFWLIIGTAAFMATLAAIYGDAFHDSEYLPPQVVMIIAGAASSWVASIVVRMMDRVEARSEDIADGAIDKVLPGTDRERDE